MLTKEESDVTKGKDVKVLETNYRSKAGIDGSGGDVLDGTGGNGKYVGGGGGGGGGAADGEVNDYEEEEFGPIMKFEEVIKEVEAQGASLPSDMLEAAKRQECWHPQTASTKTFGVTGTNDIKFEVHN